MIRDKCEFCGSVPERRTFKLKGREIGLNVFPCNCNRVNDAKEYIKKLYEDCNIDDYFLDNDFGVVNTKLKRMNESLKWINKGLQFIVYGNPGQWKTGQVTAICKTAMDQNKRVKYYRSNEILGMAINDKKEFNKLKYVDLLILDNFGKDKSEGSGGFLFNLLDMRIHNYKSTILVTNYDVVDYAAYFTQELISRLNGFFKIKVDSMDDKRKEIKFQKGENKNG